MANNAQQRPASPGANGQIINNQLSQQVAMPGQNGDDGDAMMDDDPELVSEDIACNSIPIAAF